MTHCLNYVLTYLETLWEWFLFVHKPEQIYSPLVAIGQLMYCCIVKAHYSANRLQVRLIGSCSFLPSRYWSDAHALWFYSITSFLSTISPGTQIHMYFAVKVYQTHHYSVFTHTELSLSIISFIMIEDVLYQLAFPPPSFYRTSSTSD